MEALFSSFHIGNGGVGVMVRGRRRCLAHMGRVCESTAAGGVASVLRKLSKKEKETAGPRPIDSRQSRLGGAE